MATSIYSSCKVGQQEVRLLSILPALDDIDSAPISCNLKTVRLEDLGEGQNYIALSYAWGDGRMKLPITVNKKMKQVTINLESALRQLRAEFDSSFSFWIDAICIDQDDDKEKTQQVSRMKDIYAGAQFVIVWVGEADEATNFQFMAFKKWKEYGMKLPGNSRLVEHEYDPPLQVAEDARDEDIGETKNEYKDDEDRDNHSDEDDDPLQIAVLPDILEPFFHRSYFARSWIVQEVVVSRAAVLFCGSFRIPFDKFVNACYNMAVHNSYKNLRATITDITYLALWQRMLRQSDQSEKLNLLDLLSIKRDSQASDPRDKVFALLGIADQTGGPNIAVDYSKSVEEVYTAVARHLIVAGNPLEVLSAVQRQWSKLPIPSWVPDWSQPWRCGGAMNARWKDTTFRAAGDTKVVQVPCQDQSAVCLRGFRLSVVQRSCGVRLCNRRTEDGSPFVNEDSLRADIKILGFQDNTYYDFTNELYLDAYLRTITRNLSAFSTRLDDKEHAFDRPSFYAWTQADRPGLSPPEQVWHEVSSDVETNIRDTDLLISEKGLLCLGPKITEVLDLICIFLGGRVPFVLRLREDGRYQLIGECYVHGMMDGEALHSVSEADMEDFIIA